MSRLKTYGLTTGFKPGKANGPAFLLSRLSARESRILILACEALSDADIAIRLSISESEVQSSLRATATKMGVNDSAALIQFVQRCKLLSIRDEPVRWRSTEKLYS